MSRLMEPFRMLLKKDTEFAWSQELQESFEQAKEEIVKLVESGVRCFRLGKWLALVTNWNKTVLGFVLWQKRCNCPKFILLSAWGTG